MDKRLPLLSLGVFLLLLSSLSIVLAINYGQKASEIWSGHNLSEDKTLISEGQDINIWEIEVNKEWEYLSIILFLGGCCPSFEEGDAVESIIDAPNGRSYQMRTEVGECHFGEADACTPQRGHYPDTEGKDYIILVKPPAGTYTVTIRPSGTLTELPMAGPTVGTGATAFSSKSHDGDLLANNVWWYYPDGSSEFIEDGGYFSWDDAMPRIVALGIVAALGCVGGVALMVRARRFQ